MPFSADIRVGYCNLKLNISWFWEALQEYVEDIDFDFGDASDDTVKFRTNYFENVIEQYAEKWVVYKAFNCKQSNDYEIDMEIHENIWDFLYDVAIEFCDRHPNIAKIVDKTDNE
jgi:hypothetical protein